MGDGRRHRLQVTIGSAQCESFGGGASDWQAGRQQARGQPTQPDTKHDVHH